LAAGSFRTGEVPDAYQRVGAVVELYVYALPSEPADQGLQLARLRDEVPFTMQGSGSWTVSVPLEARLGAPATCEVAVQPTHAATRVVSTDALRSNGAARAQALSIAVQPMGGARAETFAEPSVLRPMACTIEDDVVTAAGMFAGVLAPDRSARSGEVVELYVYASPTISSPEGMQVADLSREHTYPLVGGGPWMVTAPVDPELGDAVRCAVGVQSTHHFEGGHNAY
jgi:hypothetical protein